MLELGYDEGVKSTARARPLARMVRWCIDVLKPACLARNSGLISRKELHPTAYLDGLRGFAAFMVYWHHHQLWPRPLADLVFENAYGFEERRFFACLPGIRTFFTGGHFAVAVFFVCEY